MKMKKRLATAVLGLGLGLGLMSSTAIANQLSQGAWGSEVSGTCIVLKCTVNGCVVDRIYPC